MYSFRHFFSMGDSKCALEERHSIYTNSVTHLLFFLGVGPNQTAVLGGFGLVPVLGGLCTPLLRRHGYPISQVQLQLQTWQAPFHLWQQSLGTSDYGTLTPKGNSFHGLPPLLVIRVQEWNVLPPNPQAAFTYCIKKEKIMIKKFSFLQNGTSKAVK